MFTKILPAGDLFNYIKGPKDSKGVDREKQAVCIRGNDAVITRLLVAQAAFGVRPKERRVRSRLPMRSHTEWVRHCQGHLVHIINCFHETDDRISPKLERITRATENLILLGLPKDALHFSWYRHSQEKGTHSHGGMGRILLHSGKPYDPKLGAALRQRFDRLISRRLGFSDPLDPLGFRIVYGGRGSWKPKNFDIIMAVCQEATKRWRDNKLTVRGDFARLLCEFGLTVVFEPDVNGRPVLQPKGAGIPAPCYPNTVVARREDNGGIIVFCGPACRGDFSAGPWRERVEARTTAAADLRLCPYKVFAEFERCAIRRFREQRAESLHVAADRCVSMTDFEWLRPGSKLWHEPKETRQLTETDVFSPEMYWGDRLYAFVSDIDPEVDDITDPAQAPLREWVAEDNATLVAQEAELDANPTSTTRSAEQRDSAKASPCHAPEQRAETTQMAFYRPENTLSRRRLQLQICLGIARQHEKRRRVKKKREQTRPTHEKEPPISVKKEPANPPVPLLIAEIRSKTNSPGLTENEIPGGSSGAGAKVNELNNPAPETSGQHEKPKQPVVRPPEFDGPREDVPPPDIQI